MPLREGNGKIKKGESVSTPLFFCALALLRRLGEEPGNKLRDLR
jgi:hypothetical protein